MAFLRRHWPVLMVVLFPLIPLWRAVFLAETIGPFDQIRQMAPWNGPAPNRPFDVLQADAVLQFYPWRDMVFEAWGKGQLPLWNPYQLAGTPLLANSQSAGFYPPHIVMGALHVPTSWAITLLAWFHLALAGLGVMALARRLGASKEGAAIGGVLFAGSAFMLAWTALPSVIATCAWIPWVLAGVYGLFDRSTDDDPELTSDESAERNDTQTSRPSAPGPRALRRRYRRTASGLALSTAMMLLAGHLQFAFYGLLAAGLAWLCLTCFAVFDKPSSSNQSRKSYSILLPLVALALGVGMAAPQLLPVLDYSKYSHRRNVPTEEGYQAYIAGAVKPYELVGLIDPTAVGLPHEFAPERRPLSQYWPALVKPGANFAEGAIGIGPLALFGLLWFPWRSHAKRLWVPLALLASFACLMALGTVLNKPFYFLIPGWSSTGSPGRMAVLFVMGTCVIAALGIGRLRTVDSIQVTGFAKSCGILFLSSLLSVGALRLVSSSVTPAFPGMDASVLSGLTALSETRLLSMSVVALLPLLVAFAGQRKAWSRSAQFVGSTTLLIPMLALSVNYLPSSPPIASSALPDIKAADGVRIAAINEPWALIVAAPATLPPNTASLLRMHDLAGYDSLLHRDTQQFLTYVNGQDPAPPANGNIQYVKPSADPAKLAEAGVGTVLSRLPVFSSLLPKTLPNGLLEYDLGGVRGEVMGVEKTPVRTVKIVDHYDRQMVTASGPGTLVVKDRLMPGWTARVDGKETPWSDRSPVWNSPDGRQIRLWRAVDLPEGEHKVEFLYDPPGLRTGLLIFLPCALLVLAGLAIGGKGKGRVTE